VNFRNKLIFYGEELLAPRPTPQAGGPPLVGCPLLLNIFAATLPIHISGQKYEFHYDSCVLLHLNFSLKMQNVVTQKLKELKLN
jgi:hypothetical protein